MFKVLYCIYVLKEARKNVFGSHMVKLMKEIGCYFPLRYVNSYYLMSKYLKLNGN